MAIARVPLRIAVVQIAPKIGQVQANIARAHEICAKLKPRSVDLVCLPEMVFTGYVFPDAPSIEPYLEQPRTGPTSLFCAALAERLQCHVIAGYPERLPLDEVEMGLDSDGKEVKKIGANSAVIYGSSGEWIGGYRKTNLYMTDTTWAKPGTGFSTFALPPPLHQVSLAICMDLNAQPPAVWQLETGPYELADHCKTTKTRLLVLLNAWLDSDTHQDAAADWGTLNFWASRMRPLWIGLDKELRDSVDDSDDELIVENDTIAVVCNRTGEENGITFAGSSALFKLREGYGKPRILEVMTRREEGVHVWIV